MISKISIGSVQFGLDYGINNKKGIMPAQEIKSILEYSYNLGIRNIDTASVYGKSQQVLGKCDISKWNITTKISPIKKKENISENIYSEISKSLDYLKIDSVFSILVHDSMQLLDPDLGNDIFRALELIKKKGLTKKIGISIYDPILLNKIINKYKTIDIVQAPLNILDRRLFLSGWINKLKKLDIEIQVRSIFLQGLLLMSYEDQVSKFSKWIHLWEIWNNWLSRSNISSLEACLNYASSIKQIDNIIIGIDSLDQLKQIVAIKSDNNFNFPNNFYSNDTKLINPSLWT